MPAITVSAASRTLDRMASSITKMKLGCAATSQKKGRDCGLTLTIESHVCTQQRAVAVCLSNTFAQHSGLGPTSLDQNPTRATSRSRRSAHSGSVGAEADEAALPVKVADFADDL